ncbi:hypothetical protein YC2023_034993 [Brassica napus]
MILILRRFVVQIKVAFGGVEHVSQQPPRQPEQTGTSSALALPGIVIFPYEKEFVRASALVNPIKGVHKLFSECDSTMPIMDTSSCCIPTRERTHE